MMKFMGEPVTQEEIDVSFNHESIDADAELLMITCICRIFWMRLIRIRMD